VSRAVHGVDTGLHHVPDHDVIDPRWFDSGTLERAACCMNAELYGRYILESTHVIGHWGARTTEDEDVSHLFRLLEFNGKWFGARDVPPHALDRADPDSTRPSAEPQNRKSAVSRAFVLLEP
jgi:hypothetical protein